MDSHSKDFELMYKLLKTHRGENFQQNDILEIETLCGKYIGNDVIEGFRANTQLLCNENEGNVRFDNSFLQMCEYDNQIILNITEQEIRIPHMKLEDLRDFIFKKLKLKKHVIFICLLLNTSDMLEMMSMNSF